MGQGQAVLAGHVDVQQCQLHGARARCLQHGHGLAGVRRLADLVRAAARACLHVGQQGAQPRAGQGFVVNDQDVHGASSSIKPSWVGWQAVPAAG